MGKNSLNFFDISQRFIRANFMMNIQGDLYIYHNGWYARCTKEKLVNAIYTFFSEDERTQIKAADMKEIIFHIAHCEDIRVVEYPHNERYICCLDGIVDVWEMKLLEHSPNYKCMFCVNARFNGNSEKGRVFDRFLQDLFMTEDFDMSGSVDVAGIKALQEYLGYLISDCTRAKKMGILYGTANTGKSVLLSLMEKLIGPESVSNVNLTHLNSESYLAHLCEHRINICFDTKALKLKSISNIKQLTSPDDAITVRKLYHDPFSTTRKSKIVFACNTLPELDLNSEEREAYFTRILIFEFTNRIGKKRRDPNLSSKLDSERDHVFRWLLEGYKRFLENNYTFSVSKNMKAVKHRYQARYETIDSFIDDCIIFKETSKVASAKLEKKLIKYIGECDFDYIPQYKTELFAALRRNGGIHTKISVDGESVWGFRNVKLRK